MQYLKVTDDRRAALDEFIRLADVDVSLVEDNPFVLVGSLPHIADQIAAHRERWGFTSYVARAAHLPDLASLAEYIGVPNESPA